MLQVPPADSADCLNPPACVAASPPATLQSCFVDGFEVAFHHVGERLSVEVPQVGSLHAGRSEQALVISY